MFEENNSYESKPKEFLKKQGFYVVLFICLLIVGTAIALTAFPPGETEAPQPEQNSDPSVLLETQRSGDETLAAKKTPLPTATPAPTASATPLPTATPRPAPSASVKKGAAPIGGDVIWSFAAEQLLYSRTLDQWTTHHGIDIAADLGTEVSAVLSGTVEKVYEDDALGQVVTIAHTNDRLSLYGNLDPSVSVTAGQKVNAGDVVGKVGSSAVSECGDAPHLHLGFFVGGKPVNPTDYVTIPH